MAPIWVHTAHRGGFTQGARLNRRLAAVLIAAVAAVSLTGCGLLGQAAGTAGAATPEPTPAGTSSTGTSSTGSDDDGDGDTGAGSGFGNSVKDSGDLPDPCTLLSDAEVTSLTGRTITQTDRDDAEPGEATRYCQWQQESGQLDVFLSRTTQSDYDLVIADATPVDGLGEKAYELGGHLIVLYGTVQVDVYSRGDSDQENMTKARKVVEVLLPKI